jgi:hypothetical protein
MSAKITNAKTGETMTLRHDGRQWWVGNDEDDWTEFAGPFPDKAAAEAALAALAETSQS